MRLLRHKGAPERGEVRLVNGEQLDEWREKIVSHLNSADPKDRGRYRYETDWATSKNIDIVPASARPAEDTATLERAAPQKPLEGRETVEIMAKDVMDQWLTWKRTNPELFRRKLLEAQEMVPHLAHLSEAQLEDEILSLARKLEEAEAQATYQKLKIGGGWRGAVLLGGDGG